MKRVALYRPLHFGRLLLLASVWLAPLANAGESPADAVLAVTGAPEAQAFTLADLRVLPRSEVYLQEAGETVRYTGVAVEELLRRAGVPLGNMLRGTVLTSYVMAHAYDGYAVLFSLWELDASLTGRQGIIVADERNGKPLDAARGPLRLVVPGDGEAARSVRMLERLEYVRLRR